MPAPSYAGRGCATTTCPRPGSGGSRSTWVIGLHHLAGLPVEEVARELRLAPGTVKSGRRRHRRRLAGSARVVAAVVAAGVVLPARLAGRSGHGPVPATAPPTDVRGAAMFVGYWFGKTDASVFLDDQVTPAQRHAVLRRLQSLDVVDAVYVESREDAYARLMALYRSKPSLADVDPSALPASFRVRLAAIDGVARVTYESPEATYRRLPEKLRRDARDPAKVTPPFSPATIPAAFHVALDEPGRVGRFHLSPVWQPQDRRLRRPGRAGAPPPVTAQPGTGAASVRVRP
jgi:hypothetical protein